jgi:5-formyltetrahydrofolate cyclo-ligase
MAGTGARGPDGDAGAGAPPSLAERKAALRRRVLAARDALPPGTRARLSAAILARVTALEAFRAAPVVLGYASIGSEPATGAFLDAVLAGGRELVLPRVDRARRRLELHRVADLAADLRPGVWGIAEPDPARCPPAALDAIAFALVPGVAFDPRGGRLGYGAGYYDRLLAAWPAPPPLVAAAFTVQVVDEVPVGPGDRPVDRVVTECETYAREGR